MIELETNDDGLLTEDGQKKFRDAMSDLAIVCLNAVAQLNAEDIEDHITGEGQTPHVKAISETITEKIAEADIPQAALPALEKHTSLATEIIEGAVQSFLEAEKQIAMDHLGKDQYADVSTKDVWDKYSEITG